MRKYQMKPFLQRSLPLSFIIILLIIFFAEALVMFFLSDRLHRMGVIIEANLDALMLVVLISPLLWVLLASLHNATKKWEETFNAMVDGVAIHNTNYEIVNANTALYKLLGKTPRELLGAKCFHMYHYQSMPIKECPIEKARISKTTVSSEFFDATRKTWFLVSVTPVFDKKGLILGFVHTLRDITERKQREEEIHHNYDIQKMINALLELSLQDLSLEEILRQALNLVISIPWIVLEAKGSIFLIEDDPQVLVMKVQSNLAEPIQKSCARVSLGQCLCGHAALKGETQFSGHLDERHETRYAGIKPHGHYCLPIKLVNKILGVLNLYVREGHLYSEKEEMFLRMVADALAGIIERKRIEAELKLSNEKLRQIDQLKSDFVSMVSHELRTPLAITREDISLILDRMYGEMNEKQGEILTTARNNIDRLSNIINGLLDISKIEAGKVQLKKGMVNIKDLLKEVTSTFASRVEKKGLQLKLDLPKEEISIYADREKIIQVFTNLLANALKFTETGFIEISAQDRDKIVECAVVDTGIGIAPEDLPRVFGKFQQFSSAPNVKEKGSGLGLSIVKGLVELHKGKIWVESRLGAGTRFILTLPKKIGEGKNG